MVVYLLSIMLVAACGVAAARPILRRAGRDVAVVTAGGVARIALGGPGQITLELPVELQHLPDPPVLEAAPIQLLDRTEIFRRLTELSLGVSELGRPLPEHDQILAAAIAAIGDAGMQRRYTPRRPHLLPQLMRAVNDEDVSRRELVSIIARDPSLVGSLLKMANSAFYRVTPNPIETIERAIVMLGSDGLRSLITAALMQPIFEVSMAGSFPRFPDIVWEHAMLSAHAAIPHAAIVERTDQFAAELLCLVTGLAEIVLFRAAMDHYETSRQPERSGGNPTKRSGRDVGQPAPLVMASLLTSQSAAVAWQIGASWELSEHMLAALEEQMVDSEPTTPLGRSLRFGRCAGALAVLRKNSVIDDATARLSLPEGGLSPAHVKVMWKRLLDKPEDSKATGRMVKRR
jgi:HDOD domain